MKSFAALACLVSWSALAQEIGTEIAGPPPTTSTSPSSTEPETVTPTPKPTARNTGRRGQQAVEGKPTWSGPQLSAAAGSVGIRGSFSPMVGGLTGTGATTALTTGTVGLGVWATDGLALSFDIGGGVALLAGGTAIWSAAAVIGIDYHFATPASALRPLFHFSAGVNLLGTNEVRFSVVANVGGGAAYFFSKNFSLTGKLLLTVPMAFPSGNFTIGFFTATPAIGAEWYF